MVVQRLTWAMFQSHASKRLSYKDYKFEVAKPPSLAVLKARREAEQIRADNERMLSEQGGDSGQGHINT